MRPLRWIAALVGVAVLGGLLRVHPGALARDEERALDTAGATGGWTGGTQAPTLDPDAAPELASREALRLEGRIVDAHDRPVAGAQVALGDGRAVMSDADGSFAFDGLAAGDYDVVAALGDQVAEVQGYSLDATSDPIELTMVRGPTLVIRVVDAAGAPIAGAEVQASQRRRVTGTDGVARFRGVALDDEYVRATAPGHAEAGERVDTSADPAAIVEHTLTLRSGAAIAGRVIDRDGKPVPGARVELECAADHRTEYATADEDGAWSVADVAAGTWAARAASDTEIAGPDVALVHDGRRPTGGIVLRVEPGGSIAGIVVDGAGRPVAEVSVDAGPRSATTGADGRFVLAGLAPDTYAVSATSPTAGAPPFSVTLARGARIERRVVVAPAGFAGVVVDEDGAVVGGASVRALDARGDIVGWATSEDDGRFALGTPPGRYELVARRSGSRVRGAAIAASSGERGLRLVAPSPATITARVTLDGAPVPYFGVAIDEDPGATGAAVTAVRDPDGRFTLHDAELGTFAVIVVGPGFERRVVEGVVCRAGRRTDLGEIAVSRGTVVRGRVTDERGAPIAAATVRMLRPGLTYLTEGISALVRGNLTAITDAQGRYEIAGAGAIDGARLEATHPVHGASAYRALSTGEAQVDLVIAAAGAIDGRLGAAAARSALGAVSAKHVEQPDATYDAPIDATGAFHLASLPPGRYILHLLGGDEIPPAHVIVVAGARASVVLGEVALRPQPGDAGLLDGDAEDE